MVAVVLKQVHESESKRSQLLSAPAPPHFYITSKCAEFLSPSRTAAASTHSFELALLLCLSKSTVTPSSVSTAELRVKRLL